ncbi:MAG: aldo/keto reductase [Thaumarchaeota archaeon]|jgi:aryl-alcohol dehydrogenase-like predicted oxidoreductase|nr:aldo/keto reductase [Candidatus Geocrenenecus arthurdayi]
MVEYRELGRSGIKVSAIGIGTWQWGSKIWGYSKTYSVDDLIEAFNKALELGLNFFDTAEIYGNGKSEEILGRCLRNVKREEVVIATKFSPTRFTENGVRKALENSLKRLGTSYVDLYQVHWPNPLVPIRNTMRVLEKLWSEGKILAIGVSNFNLKQLVKARDSLSKTDIVSNQVEYNMLKRDIERDLLGYCLREKITIIAYSPLAQGALTGKYSKINKPTDLVRRSNPYFTSKKLESIAPLLDTLRDISSRRGRTVSQIVLNWILRWENTVPIPGVKRVSHVLDIAGSMGFRLNDEELRMIEEKLNEAMLVDPSKLKRGVQLLRNYLSMIFYEKKGVKDRQYSGDQH